MFNRKVKIFKKEEDKEKEKIEKFICQKLKKIIKK